MSFRNIGLHRTQHDASAMKQLRMFPPVAPRVTVWLLFDHIPDAIRASGHRSLVSRAWVVFSHREAARCR